MEGLVTAVSAGNATITATVGGKQATCEVTVADAVPEGLTVTTYEALLEALRTGGASADVPTLIMLGSDITIPAGGDRTNPPINGSGYFKIDGGGHTLVREMKATISSAISMPTMMPFISNSPISNWLKARTHFVHDICL